MKEDTRWWRTLWSALHTEESRACYWFVCFLFVVEKKSPSSGKPLSVSVDNTEPQRSPVGASKRQPHTFNTVVRCPCQIIRVTS